MAKLIWKNKTQFDRILPTKLKKADVLLLFLKKHGLMSGYNIVA
jgi:hypothetical protein